MIDADKWANFAKYVRETVKARCPYCGMSERFPKESVPKQINCEGCYRKFNAKEALN